jgi:hypothetical protein
MVDVFTWASRPKKAGAGKGQRREVTSAGRKRAMEAALTTLANKLHGSSLLLVTLRSHGPDLAVPGDVVCLRATGFLSGVLLPLGVPRRKAFEFGGLYGNPVYKRRPVVGRMVLNDVDVFTHQLRELAEPLGAEGFLEDFGEDNLQDVSGSVVALDTLAAEVARAWKRLPMDQEGSHWTTKEVDLWIWVATNDAVKARALQKAMSRIRVSWMAAVVRAPCRRMPHPRPRSRVRVPHPHGE